MTQNNNLSAQPVQPGLLAKRILTGWGIGLAVILFFVLGVDEPRPEWGKLWMIRPLVITPLAGACAGVFYHLMDRFRNEGGWKKITANVVSVLVYVVALWLGVVLGLAGTMWH